MRDNHDRVEARVNIPAAVQQYKYNNMNKNTVWAVTGDEILYYFLVFSCSSLLAPWEITG